MSVPMEVERVVAERLAELVGVPAVLEVPDERPAEMISVELTGSSGTRHLRQVTLAVQSWAQTRRRAAEIAAAVERAVPDLADVPDIMGATVAGTYRWPDPDSRQPRYQSTVELTVCE